MTYSLVTAGTCSLLFSSCYFLFACKVAAFSTAVENCLTFAFLPCFVFSHNLFSFRAPSFTFLHLVYPSTFTTNLFESFSSIPCTLLPFPNYWQMNPANPLDFFSCFHFLFPDFHSTSLTPPHLKVLLLLPILSVPVHHFKVQFQPYKTLRNSPLSTLCV